jgi:hypothetical protein
MGELPRLRWFPDYPKDADVALAALPYNSLSQNLSAMAAAISGRRDRSASA